MAPYDVYTLFLVHFSEPQPKSRSQMSKNNLCNILSSLVIVFSLNFFFMMNSAFAALNTRFSILNFGEIFTGN